MTARPIPDMLALPTMEAARLTVERAVQAHPVASRHLDRGWSWSMASTIRGEADEVHEAARILSACIEFGGEVEAAREHLRAELLQLAALALTAADLLGPTDAQPWHGLTLTARSI